MLTALTTFGAGARWKVTPGSVVVGLAPQAAETHSEAADRLMSEPSATAVSLICRPRMVHDAGSSNVNALVALVRSLGVSPSSLSDKPRVGDQSGTSGLSGSRRPLASVPYSA